MFNVANRKRPFKAIGAASSTPANSSSNVDDDAADPISSIIKSKKSTTPPTTLELHGVTVHFPFRPYDVQRDYMGSVLTALRTSQHGLLESPTGTGKTLCLLCSALAWQRHERGRIARRIVGTGGGGEGDEQQPAIAAGEDDDHAGASVSNKAPVIIYASRTHSQLSQVVGELRNTRYRPRHAVLGSREHMCIHPRVNPTVARGKTGGGNTNDAESKKSSSEVNNGCSKLGKERKCMYRNNLEDAAGKGGTWHPPSADRPATVDDGGGGYEQPVLDMEDLVTVGRQHKVCPFYHTRSLIKDAEIIFVPYNYLFDRDARETSLADVNFENSILIFDEAHNLEEFASESSSFDLGSHDVAACVGEVQRALQYLEVNPEMDDVGGLKENMLTLKSVLLRFEKYLCDDAIQRTGQKKVSSEGESSHPGEYIFDIFKYGAGINHANLGIFANFVKRVGDVIMEFKGNSSAASSGTPKLDHFLNCLKRAFGKINPDNSQGTEREELLSIARAKSYRVHLSKMNNKNNGGGGGFAEGRTISYWCFAPALAMRELSFLKVRSILITSGTLSPLPSFSMELGLNFPIQLENDHVIQSDQIFVRVVGKGVSGKELSSKYGRRDDPEYISELGNTLASLCRNIPGGVLVFFPSYGAMENAVARWGGPANERPSFGNGRQSGGRGGGASAAFFAARKKKRASAKKHVFQMVPDHFRANSGASSNPWKRLLSRKAIVLEPRSTADLSDAISEYKRILAAPRSTGAVLMGVCRGKISEGIDFSDDMCRAVVVTGLPFAPYYDPKVKLKREFLDAARAMVRPSIDGGFGNGKLPAKVETSTTTANNNRTLSGAEWYNQQAHRAVNQAVGRVIRHRHDYGAVLLLDHRFAEVRNKDGLSKWLRPHLRDETFGASTRGLVQFYRESKAKAEKAKAFHAQESQPPQIKYEDYGHEEENISKLTLVSLPSKDNDFANDGYVKADTILQHHDVNDMPLGAPSNALGEDDATRGDADNTTESTSELAGSGLGAMYSKGKVKSQQMTNPSRAFDNKKAIVPSSFGDIDRKPRGRDSMRIYRRDPVKQRPQRGRQSDAAKLQAKLFFEKANLLLGNDELLKVKRLIVSMKGLGESKNEGQYIKTARELILVLVDSDVNSERIQLISSLFPLLPIKYRYKLEKMASILAFDKSPLRSCCKESLNDQEFTTIRSLVLSMTFSQSSSHGSIALTDRVLLEDSQKILSLLVKNDVNVQYFMNLLPERQLRKVRTLALEMKRSRDVAKAKERSLNFKGENCVNTALFRRTEQKRSAVRLPLSTENLEDAESQHHMAQALSQSMSINRQKKERVIDFQRKAESKAKPHNPYRRPALKGSTKVNLLSASDGSGRIVKRSKGLRNDASAVLQASSKDQLDSMDIVDRCLHQVKSDSFVQPKTRLERINGKIKAHVPKGFTCPICSETPKEPLMAESCHHSACFNCWKSWLKRQNTCPTCRAPTTMKDLSKLVFAKETGAGAPSLTQICADEDDSSDNEELEIIAN